MQPLNKARASLWKCETQKSSSNLGLAQLPADLRLLHPLKSKRNVRVQAECLIPWVCQMTQKPLKTSE